MKKRNNNPIRPLNFVGFIPILTCLILAVVVVGGLLHVYSKGKEAFDSTLESEKRRLSIQVSPHGDVQISKYKFVKSIWAREEKTEKGSKKLLLWESLPGLNAEIAGDIDMLSCDKMKVDKNWSEEKTKRVNAWCSLIGKNDSEIDKTFRRQVVNKNSNGNKELFDQPPYNFWDGIQKFPDNEISKNGEYTISIYPSVQEGMSKFMIDNNMQGSVFAYRPSNGDIYCMASAPGWIEREKNHPEFPKDGAQMNNNFYSFTPGSTMKPVTLLILKDQGIDLNILKFAVKHEESGYGGDSHILEDGSAAHCSAVHSQKEQSASEGLGNSCNSFFAMSAELLDLEKAKNTLEEMDFYVEEYTGDPKKTKKYKRAIDKILYNQSVFPLEKTMKHSFRNVQNFIGEGNLLVSPIDMAVLTALFGKLSKDINSKVYFPRIWLPADENKRNGGSPELLLTEKNPVENEHVAKLSNFVSARKESIADVGMIWKKAFNEHYRNKNKTWPENSHLDLGSKLTAWSQWIDMAKTGTVAKRHENTCLKYDEKGCVKKNRAETRKQRTLSLYSEELDLAAYIVIENYSGMMSKDKNSKIKLDSTSMKLTELVAKALGKELSKEPQKDKNGKEKKSKKDIEQEQWDIFYGRTVKKQNIQQKQPQKQKDSKPQNNKKQPQKKSPVKQKGKSKKK